MRVIGADGFLYWVIIGSENLGQCNSFCCVISGLLDFCCMKIAYSCLQSIHYSAPPVAHHGIRHVPMYCTHIPTFGNIFIP